jgi:hypothetical protein
VSEFEPPYTPLFEAQHAGRFERQRLIRDYQSEFACRLVVVSDAIFPESVALFEELVGGLDPEQDLHIMLRRRAETAKPPCASSDRRSNVAGS